MNRRNRPKMSATPPSKADFIENDDVEVDETEEVLAWEQPGVRDEMLKMFNLRLPEPFKLKLDYIGKHHHSAHQFCLDVLLPAIDAEIDRLTKKS